MPTEVQLQPMSVKVHPDDNVAIVVNAGGLEAGTLSIPASS